MADTIGFIGLGAMGAPMARNLLRKGVQLCVHDADSAKLAKLTQLGARSADSPAAVARAAQIIFTMLPDFAAVRDVMTGEGGLAQAQSTGLLLVNTSTVGPRWGKELAQLARQHGMRLLEAPVTPGTHAAEAGTLNFFIAGDGADLQRVRPLLEAMGRRIIFLGEHGRAQALKMVNNSLSLCISALVAEAIALGEKAGLPADMLLDILSGTSADSYQLRQKLPRMIARDYSPGGSIDLAVKDLSVALEFAAQIGADMPLVRLTRDDYAAASARGQGPLDTSALVEYYRSGQ